MEPFIALALTLNALNLDSIDALGAFRSGSECYSFIKRERIARDRRKEKVKLACVPRREFNRRRDEVFR